MHTLLSERFLCGKVYEPFRCCLVYVTALQQSGYDTQDISCSVLKVYWKGVFTGRKELEKWL